MLNKITKYLKETGAELQKMTWPTREEMVGSTLVTIIFSVIMAFFIGVVDRVLITVIKLIFGGGAQG